MSHTDKSELELYKDRINRAANSKIDDDIDNSTTDHARIAISKIIASSEKLVRVMTTSFRHDFWIGLVPKILKFMEKNEKAKFEVVSITKPDADSIAILKALSKRYLGRFNAIFLTDISDTTAENTANYIIGDDEMSRYEVSDKKAESGLVTAIINFGNKQRVNRYNSFIDSAKKRQFEQV